MHRRQQLYSYVKYPRHSSSRGRHSSSSSDDHSYCDNDKCDDGLWDDEEDDDGGGDDDDVDDAQIKKRDNVRTSHSNRDRHGHGLYDEDQHGEEEEQEIGRHEVGQDSEVEENIDGYFTENGTNDAEDYGSNGLDLYGDDSDGEYDGNEFDVPPSAVIERIEKMIVLSFINPLFFSSDAPQVPQMSVMMKTDNQRKSYRRIQSDDDNSDDSDDDDDDGDLPGEGSDKVMTKPKWSFHHKTQCRTMTSIVLVASFCHELLLAGRTTTTREVYYHYVTHFHNQRECDKAIWNLSELLGVSRPSLGLVASPKGWFCGCIDLYNSQTGQLILNGRELDVGGVPITSSYYCTNEWATATTDPGPAEHRGNKSRREPPIIRSDDARAILVIEKEGVYRRLSEDKFFLKHYPCILVTGKGYPDVATRKWVQRIQQTLKIPALGLCDCNPFGVSVLHSYQYGDTPQKHRNLSQMNDDQIEDAIDSDDDDMAQSKVSSSQSISRTSRCKARLQLYWVGLRPSLIEKLDLPRTVFQQLSSIDKKRLDSLLLSDHSFQHQGLDSDQRRQELEDMGKYKVELEALNWLGIDYMSKYIGHLVKSQNVI